LGDIVNINTIANKTYNLYGMNASTKKSKGHKKADQSSKKGTDEIEISKEARELQEEDALTATSGKESYEITKGEGKNAYIIHFSDSAALSRVLSRGYIIVNGVKIEFSDEMSKMLERADKQTQRVRESAFDQLVREQGIAFANKQEEEEEDTSVDMAEILKIASKIAQGIKVSAKDEKKLMEANMKLYIMAKNIAMLAKEKNKKDPDESDDEEESKRSKVSGGSTSQKSSAPTQVKSFETQVEVSLGDTPGVTSAETVEVN